MADLDPVTGQMTDLGFQGAQRVHQPPEGFYAHLDGHLLALYRYEGLLHVRLDDADVALTDDVHVCLRQGPETNVLSLHNEREVVLEFEYTRPVIVPPLEDDLITCGAEEEHFDFGLFIYNVANQPRGRDRMLAQRP